MNFLFGLLILFYKFYMPEASRATAQEASVMNSIYQYIFLIMIAVALLNLITLIFNYKDKALLFAYLIAILASSFYFLKTEYICILYILSSILTVIEVLRENMVYTNNMFYIVIISIVIVAIGLVGISILTYKDDVKKLVKEENKGYVTYEESFFKNISMLSEDAEFYLNVERNGKWGYINSKGEIKIDFEYDYATPFVQIEKYDKYFDVALVCKDNIAGIILKNKRNVLTYSNKINKDDFDGQIAELQRIYEETFKQEGNVKDKFTKVANSDMNSIKSYDNVSYRYPYNEEYDIYITVSQSGGKNRYEFLKNDNTNIKVGINCDFMQFDEHNLYVYSNGYLPYYKPSEGIQGWYNKETKKFEIEGDIQILDFFEDQLLIKDYYDNTYYFADENGDPISERYKDIFVLDDGYIVKNSNDKYIIINKKFEQVCNNIEYDYINPMLINQGIYICGNLPIKVNFNNYGYPNNIEYDLVDLEGNIITLKNSDGTEIPNPAYTTLYYIDNRKNVSSYDTYLENLTDIDYKFIGEEYYKEYFK